MKTSELQRAAEAFRSMHHGEMLILPNAWDALSARVFAEAGCKAIATTSAGVAWSLGSPDGERVPWNDFLAATGRIARVLSVPLTVDFESGFSTTSAELAEHVRAIIGAGASGVNLEDSRDHAAHGLLPLEIAAERISIVRDAAAKEGVPIVINARTDSYLQPAGEGVVAFADVVQRCRTYVSAGADCVYPIGLADIHLIGQLTAQLRSPVNVMVRPGAPTLKELRAAGVARVSTATGPALLTAGVLMNSIVKLRETGSAEHFASPFTYPRMQKLFEAGD
jgi:2-methylisocitrate lyase-like PEP mutase family enzyme